MFKDKAIDPLTFFPNNSKAARFWFFLACALGVVVFLQPILLVDALKAKERIIIMDESGTFYVSPLKNFEESSPMHDFIVSIASNALLARGPKGADNPPLQRQLFYKKGFDKIDKFYLQEQEHFSKKKIHQKQEIKDIKILKTSETTVLARVNGQLIRIGTFEGRKFTNVKNFALQLTLFRNPRMGSNGRLPLIVSNWQIKISDRVNPTKQNQEGAQL